MDAPTKNPVYLRFSDPFFGMSTEYLAGRGDGDAGKGYDIVLQRFVINWNEGADARRAKGIAWPKTSIENGLEWIPVPQGGGKTMQRLPDGTLAEPPLLETNNE